MYLVGIFNYSTTYFSSNKGFQGSSHLSYNSLITIQTLINRMNITPCPKKIRIKNCLRMIKHLSSDNFEILEYCLCTKQGMTQGMVASMDCLLQIAWEANL
jgi:hypothetical protein